MAASPVMSLLIAMLSVVVAVAAYVASLACRFTRRRHRRAGWRQVVWGVTAVDGLWCAWLLKWFLFQRWEWDLFPIPMSFYIPFTLSVVSIAGFIGALPTVLIYRRLFRDENIVA